MREALCSNCQACYWLHRPLLPPPKTAPAPSVTVSMSLAFLGTSPISTLCCFLTPSRYHQFSYNAARMSSISLVWMHFGINVAHHVRIRLMPRRLSLNLLQQQNSPRGTRLCDRSAPTALLANFQLAVKTAYRERPPRAAQDFETNLLLRQTGTRRELRSASSRTLTPTSTFQTTSDQPQA